MARAFRISDEVDEQHAVIGTIWWPFAELVTPQPEPPPGAQFVRGQADDIRMFSWLRNKFKIVQPDFLEGQLIRSHGPPTF